jgi:Nuclease subunit of the excinuclease complex
VERFVCFGYLFLAGEKKLSNINSKTFLNKLKDKNNEVFYLGKKINLKSVIKPYLNEENSIVFMGAGSVTYMAQSLFTDL